MFIKNMSDVHLNCPSLYHPTSVRLNGHKNHGNIELSPENIFGLSELWS